jgi:type IV secretion system protein VirB1
VAVMEKIVTAESGGNSLAIHDNGTGQSYFPETLTDAVAIASKLLKNRDASVDLGLAQINSRNLARFGATLQDAFDPCSSVKMGATIYAEGLQAAVSAGLSSDAAVRAALSRYNTGRLDSSVGASYASRVLGGHAIVATNVKTAPILVDLASSGAGILVSFNK